LSDGQCRVLPLCVFHYLGISRAKSVRGSGRLNELTPCNEITNNRVVPDGIDPIKPRKIASSSRFLRAQISMDVCRIQRVSFGPKSAVDLNDASTGRLILPPLYNRSEFQDFPVVILRVPSHP